MTEPKPARANTTKSPRTRAKPKKPEQISTNHGALVAFLAFTFRDGIPASDLPVAQAALGLAAQVDANPAVAALWAQYRGAVDDLIAITARDNDAIDHLLDQLRATHSDPEN